MADSGHDSHSAPVADPPVHNPVIERLTPLILHLAYEVDPWVQVSLTPYHWRGEDLLDIGLTWQGHSHHLQVSAARLELIAGDPHMLEHDIAGAVADMKRDAAAHPAPAPGSDSAKHDHGPGHVHLNRRQRRAQQRALAEAGAASPPTPPSPSPPAHAAHEAQAHAHVARPSAAAEAEPNAHADAHDHPSITETDAVAVLPPAEQQIYTELTALVRELVHHLAPDAAVTFSVYVWHGSATVDVAIDRHGHRSHYEVTLERAALFLGDHHMLEHDLEGVIGH